MSAVGSPHPSLAGRAGALARDLMAGALTSIVLIANIVSFAALMFPGALAAGASTAIWAMLVGSGLTGIWVAWKTSLPPIATGIDSPTGAVLVLLSASAGAAVLAAGGDPPAATQATLLVLAAATAVTGLLLLGLGLARWGSYLRFVPFFVVAGFLAATGALLIAGGVRMSTGRSLAALAASAGMPELARLACALAVLAVLLALRRWARSALAMPLTLLALTLAGSLLLHRLGLADPARGWYLASLGALAPWSPLDALAAPSLPGPAALRLLPELLAVALVALVSMVTKTASLEVARKTAGDLDRELRAHGVATLAVVPLGGIVGSLQLGTSQLLRNAGGATRFSGVACSAVLVLVALTHFDLMALVPLPIAAGLVMFLGVGFLVDALARPLAQRAWRDGLLALAIMAACVLYGYLAGVLGGIVAACLLFAVSYARIGAVRQQLSRAQFAGNVSRPPEAARRLAESGEAIQLYWLSGYIFFGSSEGLFERVRHDLDARPPRQVAYIVLDFGLVAGADASASISLTKLRHLCQQRGAQLVFSAVDAATARALRRDGLFAEHAPFADANAALAWCEDRLLDADAGTASDAGSESFADWLHAQLGDAVRAEDFLAYLERRDFAQPAVLYRQGEPSDAIDLVAAGRLVVEVDAADGTRRRVRSIATCTVVGEMGFYRRTARSATVSTESPATVYTLTRAAFERLRAERPELAGAFEGFLLRMLSERLGLTERMMVALGR